MTINRWINFLPDQKINNKNQDKKNCSPNKFDGSRFLGIDPQ